MGLAKSKGNMYPWVTHTHSHLGGKCPHGCSYCYVQLMSYPNVKTRYSGPLCLLEKELQVRYGKGRIIFIEHMNDLFSFGVPGDWVTKILDHCAAWPENEYVFQTKDPWRLYDRLSDLPKNSIIGTTIETDRDFPEVRGAAPKTSDRARAMARIRGDAPEAKMFVTVEPVLDFSPQILAGMILTIAPDFVNIGADSKGADLPEPPWWKVNNLISRLTQDGVEIRVKNNLERLKE